MCFLKSIRKLVYINLKKLYKVCFLISGKLPVMKKTIVFESFLGKQYSDNPRAIYEYMIKHKKEYRMYWSFDKHQFKYYKNKELKAIKRFSFKWLIIMSRAEYWVTNSRLPLWIIKPKHTKYIQTWHGTPLKKLAADMDEVHMPGTSTKRYKYNFLKEASKWDYLISPNNYSTKIFKRAFQFNKKLVESGYPRNDNLYNFNSIKKIEELKKSMNLPVNKKIILYAPTWRDNQYYSKGKYKFNIKMNLDKMMESLKNQYIILLRLHYLVSESINLKPYSGFIFDFSSYEDIRELYLVSDLLITDYSSVFFDYANLKRPIIFYVYDLENYRDKLRGFYLNLEEKAPGPLVKNTDELIYEIRSINNNKYSEVLSNFHNEFCSLEDGMSSKRVVEQIFN
ncbi:CDP-glycerol glycerophosphotransferase family protein [Virgibacillus proomii]|uniref:CDP-glycerol glycerophosphotransferase family protein n=1 Tax=Virgibacillus proomii TaxID=84407 RepID=UPI002646E174|nr:CDP-glycerol glycerophosphotransferase family protein [Virgibacillus proomii]